MFFLFLDDLCYYDMTEASIYCLSLYDEYRFGRARIFLLSFFVGMKKLKDTGICACGFDLQSLRSA